MSYEEPKDDQYLKSRRYIVDDLRKATIGNDWRSDEEVELNYNPLFHFISGVLYPIDHSSEGYFAENKDNQSYDDDIDNQSEDKDIETNIHNRSSRFSEDDSENEQDNLIDRSVDYKQSSFGINFITLVDEIIEVDYGFSKYVKKKIETESHKRSVFSQLKTKGTISFEISPTSLNQKKKIDDCLIIRLDSRIVENNVISTVSMSHQGTQQGVYELEACYFQVGVEIRSTKNNFQPVKTPLQAGSGDQAASLDLLFRKKLSYASGNGCATDWEDSLDCRKIWTEFLPSYEVKKIEPTLGVKLKMECLANIDNKLSNDEAYGPVDQLAEEYKYWILEQEKEKETLSDKHKETAEKHISSAKIWLKRINKGIEIIKNNEEASLAFRSANYAMLIQANRLNLLERKNTTDELKCTDKELIEDFRSNTHKKITYSWYPFQLAFVLGIIPDIVNKDNIYRNQVDLIWFPTGGGKTEAYLGALAFSIIYRRILDPDDNGVVSLMRYTLRLLTADQFRRSASLICAIDFIRKQKVLGLDLGEKNISIGLWVGRKASPATHKDAHYYLKKGTTDVNGNQSFMLDECPWCKNHLTNPDDSGYEYSMQKVTIKCPDTNCHFNESLPVYLWQEAIFDEKPTLLLGTIDNFCKLTWLPEAIELFNGPKISPPDLIIQDELHLISGPLGSMVGLYESVLLKILERDEIGPKIIGATATLSLEGSQSKNLYRGKDSSIFPPQVLNWGDSFFAKEINEKYGRLYLGYFGSSKGSMIESAFSASIPLLQAPNKILPSLFKEGLKGDTNLTIVDRKLSKDSFFSVFHKGVYTEYKILEINDEDDKQNIVINKPLEGDLPIKEPIYPKPNSDDMSFSPYGTLVWYFNSKRELAYISNQTIRMGDSLRANARYEKNQILGPKKAPSRFARKIKKYKELTGRLPQDEIQTIITDLRKPWMQVMGEPYQDTGIDILFSTNMISVGVDIPRLGLMLVHGQPRTTAEYIQATSRVGRKHPGLVTTVYNHAKSKDRSIYEMFKNYHQSFYRHVEAVSVTPFASGARDRALPAIFIALARHFGINSPSLNENNDVNLKLKKVKSWILDTLDLVDKEEYENTEKDIDEIIRKWNDRQPVTWGKMAGKVTDEVKLMGVLGDPESEFTIFNAPTSMRSVDAGVSVKLHSGHEEITAEDEY